MRRVHRLARACTLAALGLAARAGGAVAQGTPAASEASAAGAHTRADSLAELAALDALVMHHPRDASAWHRKGMLAAALVEGRRNATLMAPDAIALARSADSSLRIAVGIAPDSAQWALDLSYYLLASHYGTVRHASWTVARRAVDAAKRGSNPVVLAAALDAAGMGAWRNYETFAHITVAGPDSIDRGPNILERAQWDPVLRARLIYLATGDDASQFSGEADFRIAQQDFTDALAADPTSRAALRHLYMTMAERERWDELRHAALERVERQPVDAVSWLTLGLAYHRIGDDVAAARAFDRGFTLLPASERARLTSLTRVLPPKHLPGDTSSTPDSVTYVHSSAAERARIERRFWAENDPLAMNGVNEHRNEFYARVIYSELMWSVDESYIRGSETDRADLLTRYGPPVLVLKPRPDTTLWIYPYRKLVLLSPRAFGVAFYQPPDTAGVDGQTSATPVSWQDPPAARPDSVRTFVARFRAGPDSAGVYVAAAIGIGRLASGVRRGSASVDVALQVNDDDARPVLRDSTRVRIAAEDTAAGDVRAWKAAIPAGRYDFRVEALGVASRRAARGHGRLAAERASGFGVSDLLLAARIDPPEAREPRRWSDYASVPNAGVFALGAPVALLWETYDLGVGADSASRYRVTLTVEPASRGGAGSFAARVLAGAAGAVGLGGQSGNDGRLSIAYDRTEPARAVVVDHLTLDLGGAPAGRYVARVTVTDAVTGRSAATVSTFRVLQ